MPAFQGEVERFQRLTLYSGYSFGNYRFLAHGLGSHFRYASWQAAPHIRQLFAEGKADYVPMRFGEVTRIVSKSGPIQPHVVLVQVSPPRRGHVSLGVSVSLYQDFIRSASLVIAEINPHMPWTVRRQPRAGGADSTSEWSPTRRSASTACPRRPSGASASSITCST